MSTPFNIKVMDVDRFVQDRRLLPVTTALIKEPSTNEFHPDGFFSETIFGRIGTLERLTTHAYIELNMKIISPVLYASLRRLGGFYVDLMAGRVYATWNAKKATFERVFDDPETVPGADTGFSFFVKFFPQIKFNLTESLTREARVDLLNEYRDIGLYDKYIVQPAGLRDIQNDNNGKMIQDDINKLYTTLLAYTRALPAGTTSPLYDGVKFNIQNKGNEIYEYLTNTMDGKRGYMQGSYGSRKIAMGTRNVITAATYLAATPDDPQALRPDETMMGVFQTMKALQPEVFYHLKVLLFTQIFGDETTGHTVSLINPKTLRLEYQEISEEEKQKWISSDGVNAFINRFSNADVRGKPMMARNTDGKPFYLMLVYDDDENITFFRSIDDLKSLGHAIDRSKIRPMTWIESCYVATQYAAEGKHVFITRYPVLGDGSCYPSKIHVCSTSPARIVKMIDLAAPDQTMRVFPEYPILGNAYEDTVKVAYDRLGALGADFDGDTVSANVVFSEDANEECARYLQSYSSIVDTQKRLRVGNISDIGDISLYNLTR